MSPSAPPLKPAFMLLCALAALHLVLVVLGSFHLFDQPAQRASWNAVQAYGAWTGATSGYAFFAPEVGKAHRITIDLKLPSGEVLHEPLSFSNESLNIRAYAMALRFTALDSRAGYQDNMARAWAATMFGRHPDAREATVRVERMDLPPIAQYQSGERPSWVQVYRADFARRTPSSSARTSLP